MRIAVVCFLCDDYLICVRVCVCRGLRAFCVQSRHGGVYYILQMLNGCRSFVQCCAIHWLPAATSVTAATHSLFAITLLLFAFASSHFLFLFFFFKWPNGMAVVLVTHPFKMPLPILKWFRSYYYAIEKIFVLYTNLMVYPG